MPQDIILAVDYHDAHCVIRRPGPCLLNCTNNNEPFALHTGGVIAAYADGSVRFISDTIELPAFAAQGRVR